MALQLFKDAVNVGFMVKYMFREDLALAKDKFKLVVTNKDNFKKMPNPNEVQAMLKQLVDDTFFSYGTVGIFDPTQLATIDFLNQPELLVELVQASKRRESRQQPCRARTQVSYQRHTKDTIRALLGECAAGQAFSRQTLMWESGPCRSP